MPRGVYVKSQVHKDSLSKSIKRKWAKGDYSSVDYSKSEDQRLTISNSLTELWRDPRYRQSCLEGRFVPGYFLDDGYRYLSQRYDHPLANHEGYVAEHRMVLYDAIGKGPHSCHWGCGKELEWGTNSGIITDHLDEDRLNNRLENLVVSCNSCNMKRGKKCL